jgi:Saxitoxin biosynthesis operon protein SxtJ
VAIMNLDTGSKKEQRNFGLLMAGAISAVDILHWLIRGREELALWPFIPAGAFLLLGLIFPKGLERLFVIWMKFALLVNGVMTRVLLSLVWILLITPMRAGLALRGKDPLNRTYWPDASSYWEDAEEQPDELNDYKNQF